MQPPKTDFETTRDRDSKGQMTWQPILSRLSARAKYAQKLGGGCRCMGLPAIR